MRKRKVANWKARCIAAEQCAEFLNIEKAVLEIESKNRLEVSKQWEQLYHQQFALKHSTEIVEKIVEKEVLPSWFICFHWFFISTIGVLAIVAFLRAHQLQTPILQPYKVEVNRFKHEPELVGKLVVCQEAWREDEHVIRQLKRRLEP